MHAEFTPAARTVASRAAAAAQNTSSVTGKLLRQLLPERALVRRRLRTPRAARPTRGEQRAPPDDAQARDRDEPRVVVVIPAHNEEDQLPAMLESVRTQSRAPDSVVVVADNCSDRTAVVARAAAVDVLETVSNSGRKAGALNQAWSHLAPSLRDDDLVLVMDADTVLCDTFVESAVRHHAATSDIGGVGGCFYGREISEGVGLGRYLGLLQRLEYARYHRSIARRKGITTVLSGTATMFRARTLRRLVEDRGFLYDTSTLVEDYEITLALRHRGFRVISPKECVVHTEVMPTITKLWRQRIRWQRGTLDELRKYGFSRITAVEYGRQFLMGLGVPIRVLFISAIALSFLFYGGFEPHRFWAWLALFFGFERAYTVRELGRAAMLASLVLLPEIVYDMFGECYFVRSLWLHLLDGDRVWHAT